MRILISALLLTGISAVMISSAQAEILFAPAIGYTQTEVETDTATSESTRTIYDLRLGFLQNSGLFVGGMYSLQSIDPGPGADKLSAAGPTLGFNHRNGFFIFVTYHLMATYKFANSSDDLVDGMGPQADIGWVFPMTSSIFLGPQISYRSIEFKKRDSGLTDNQTFKHISPMITLWFKF